MKPEELLKILNDAGLEGEAIKGLLEQTLALVQPEEKEVEEKVVTPEINEDDKMKEIFGI